MPRPTHVRPALAAFLFLAFLIATRAPAHDYWFAQEPSVLEPGDACTIRLRVGDELVSELERPLQLDMTTRFEWHTAESVENLLESVPDSTLPVFQRHLPAAQTGLLVMERKFHPIESTVGQFLDFLEHEELTELAARFGSTAPETPLRRRYARSIKALVRVGEPSAGQLHSKTTGQTIELRLLTDPHAAERDSELVVHAQFEGEDLDALLVKAFVEGSDGQVSIARSRTDAQGIARFTLDRTGMWVLRTTYLTESDTESMDWDTHYATFSFVYP